MPPSYCRASGRSSDAARSGGASGGTLERLRAANRGGVEGAPVARRQLAQRTLPGALAGGLGGGAPQLSAQLRRGGELQQGAGDLVGVGTAEQARVAVLDQGRRTAFGDGDDREAAGGGLEHHLAVSIGAAAEEESVGAGVDAGKFLAREPAEEGRPLPQPLAQLGFLGAAAGEQQVQARVAVVGADEAL